MTRREQIEQVLREHGVIPGLLTTKFEVGQVIEELTAIPCDHPTPSREVLEQIWHQVFTQNKPLAACKQRLFDAILAWATGQPERRWCEHLIWDAEFQCYRGVATDNVNLTLQGWTRCPICSITRPPDS